MSKKQDHKRWRKEFNKVCLARDNQQCAVCASSEGVMDVHHILPRKKMPNGGYVLENGITLCESCHVEAEKYYSAPLTETFRFGDNSRCNIKYFPSALFSIIESSEEKAIEASKELR